MDKNQYKDTLKHFYIPKSFPEYFPSYEGFLKKIPPYATPIVEAFKENLDGTTATISLPYIFASHAVTSRRFQAVHTAEKIRSMGHALESGISEEKREALAYQVAKEKFRKELIEKRSWYAEAVVGELSQHYRSDEITESFDEVLRQGCVLLWSSMEIFCRDIIKVYLNNCADGVDRFRASPEVRGHFHLNQQMLNTPQTGDSLLNELRFNSLKAFKVSCGAIFQKNQKLKNALDSHDLLVLSNRRHLIVHKRAIADREYLTNTDDQGGILGSKIRISPDDLERYISSCCDVVSSWRE